MKARRATKRSEEEKEKEKQMVSEKEKEKAGAEREREKRIERAKKQMIEERERRNKKRLEREKRIQEDETQKELWNRLWRETFPSDCTSTDGYSDNSDSADEEAQAAADRAVADAKRRSDEAIKVWMQRKRTQRAGTSNACSFHI